MQSWSNIGQNGSDEQSNQWQNNFAYNGQNGQFDPHQWSQPLPDQDAYSHLNPQDGSAPNFFGSAHQDDAFLAGNLHQAPAHQPGFHGGHSSLPLNHQQFGQASHDVIDPSFNDMHPDLYSQQGKMNLGDSMNHLAQVQGHTHSHGHPQPYQQNAYQFQPQNEQNYESPIQQFAQPRVIQQQARQQSHTPVQQYDGLQEAYGHGHNFSRPPQQPSPQPQQTYTQPTFAPHVNGQVGQFQTNTHAAYQQPQSQPPPQQQQKQPQQQQHPPYHQAAYVPQKQFAFVQPLQPPQPSPNPTYQQTIRQQPTFIASASPTPTPHAQYQSPQPSVNSDNGQAPQAAAEPPVKKRKRMVKSASEAPSEPVVTHTDASAESIIKKAEEVDALVPPTPSAEDAQLIAKFQNRPKAAQARHPAIKGLPYLVFDGSIKLPAPKSYDKLAPLVALPPRSGKAIVPDFGYNLPCEVQGMFTSRYRPSPTKGGLDERRIEAKVLLDEFDRSMRSLGRRRPKYTEYPHAFKEQLKSDEASKNKAEKKAKKELEDERNKPIRAPTRPNDPTEAVAWDIIGIVHLDQNSARTSALIANRVHQAGEYIIKLRGEINRAKQEFDQATKDKVPEAELATAEKDFEQKKEMFYRALDAMMEHADDAVLDNLGGHQKMVLSLVNVLIMCTKLSDYSGKLPKVVWELFTHLPMTEKIAKTANFDAVRKRFSERGDDEVKESLREITSKVKKCLKAAEPETATGYTGTSAASRAKGTAKGATESSTKRGRDDDTDSRTVKKIAVESTSGSLSKKMAQPKIQLQSASKKTSNSAASSILPGKARPVAKSVPRPEATKADVKTTSDEKTRSDVKNALNKIEGSKSLSGKPESNPPASKTGGSTSSSALSGIASLLNSINAPKPKAEASVAPAKETKQPEIPETPEERAKWERKEARRKLRVTWKPENELVQVKIFQKEESEDEGRDISMTRDAADDRSEGMVLKQRANVEDEDDDDDIPYQPWVAPTPLDFSSLSDEARKKNYTTRGGSVTFETEEQKRIAERENTELMAIYAVPEDIPPTPRSPPHEMVVDSDSRIVQLPQDNAKFEEIYLRWRDAEQMGVDGALYTALKRLDSKADPSSRLDSILGNLQNAPTRAQTAGQPAASSSYGSTSKDIGMPLVVGPKAEERVLAMLGSEQVKHWRDRNPIQAEIWRSHYYADAMVRLSANAVEEVAQSLGGKPYPATLPPEWLKHEKEAIREWWVGYNKEAMARQKREDEERAKAEAEASTLRAAAASTAAAQAPGDAQDWAAYYAQQQQDYAPYMALLQQMTNGQHQAGSFGQQHSQIPDNQLQSMLAALGHPGQQQQQQQAPQQAQAVNPVSYLNPNDPSYQQYMLLAQMAQGQQAAAMPPPPPSNDRDWDRGDDRGDQRDGKDGRRKRGPLPPHKPANKALIGTKPCTFWQQGKCARGDKCTFRHD